MKQIIPYGIMGSWQSGRLRRAARKSLLWRIDLCALNGGDHKWVCGAVGEARRTVNPLRTMNRFEFYHTHQVF